LWVETLKATRGSPASPEELGAEPSLPALGAKAVGAAIGSEGAVFIPGARRAIQVSSDANSCGVSLANPQRSNSSTVICERNWMRWACPQTKVAANKTVRARKLPQRRPRGIATTTAPEAGRPPGRPDARMQRSPGDSPPASRPSVVLTETGRSRWGVSGIEIHRSQERRIRPRRQSPPTLPADEVAPPAWAWGSSSRDTLPAGMLRRDAVPASRGGSQPAFA